MTLYATHALQQEDDIRLFTIRPGQGAAVIQVTVAVACLASQPVFKALSYTWGNPYHLASPYYRRFDTSRHHVVCNGETIFVTENLFEAMWQLRENGETSAFWIDALSINQKCTNEVNRQIPLIPQIYFQATLVVVWLGHSDADTAEVSKLLAAHEKNDAFWASVLQMPARYGTVLTVREVSVLSELCSRTWFHRVWTLQEMLMPHNTIGLCGPYEIDIAAAAIYAGYMLQNLAPYHLMNGSLDPKVDQSQLTGIQGAACISAWMTLTWPGGGFGGRALLRYPSMDYKRQIPNTFKWLVSLELLVHEARSRQCTKLRDKILAPLTFALNGMFTPKEIDSFHTLAEVAQTMLDCKISAAVLYRRFTSFMIRAMGNLDILSRCSYIGESQQDGQTDSEISTLPSWVPRFNEPPALSLIDSLLRTKVDAAGFLRPYSRPIQQDFDDTVLVVEAVMFARVTKVSQYAVPAETVTEWLWNVRGTDEYRRSERSAKSKDVSHYLLTYHADRIEEGHQYETERLRKFQRGLVDGLSVLSLVQVNTRVCATLCLLRVSG